MGKTVIVDGFRTPFCKAGTHFKNIEPYFLAAMAVKEMTQRMNGWGMKPGEVDRVVGSNVATPINAPNIARVAATMGGLPDSVVADGINKNCGSGVAAINYGRMYIESGQADTVMVVGVESMSKIVLAYDERVKEIFTLLSMSRTPSEKVRNLFRLIPKLIRFQKYPPQSGLVLGLTDPICNQIMGKTAENIARAFNISRQEQDAFACRSNNLAEQADKAGFFKKEVWPVFAASKFIKHDNGIRNSQTVENLARLKPVFDKKYGTVTAGNSSQVTDGAACMLLMAEEKAKAFGLPILGRVGVYADAGYKPEFMGLSPVLAIAKLLKATGLSIKDFPVIELNEAFASVAVACMMTMDSDALMKKWFGDYGFTKALGRIENDQINLNGGAIALGHPPGVSGLRLAITALCELARKSEGRPALISACVGGGQGVAMILERFDSAHRKQSDSAHQRRG
ncbi:MAG: thiolase family protein [bacterium]|nr:thiolase family protein [bacterium]